MRRALSILAVVAMTVGLFSCQPESSAEEDALYETLASDDNNSDTEDRE